MRKLLLLTAIGIGVYYFIQEIYLKEKDSVQIHQTVDTAAVNYQAPLRIVFFQDVSGSIKDHGVELVASSVFNPYYEETGRTIELNFGVIANLSARKMITVTLPAATFTKPVIADFRTASITDKRKYKEKYLKEQATYESDSASYFSERNRSIAQFRKQVDATLAVYKAKLTSETDLVTAVSIADKVFNFSSTDAAVNYLLLNSDGLDSYHKTVRKMNTPATVILINANGINNTSIDGIVSKTFQSPEQAIQFTLKNSSQLKL